ncbi:MAG: glycosyltransferase family 39 protein [Proteobacteria bacterium]|nr:glycosyltransferase family 39 protein [Pseudomonadota bacterium]
MQYRDTTSPASFEEVCAVSAGPDDGLVGDRGAVGLHRTRGVTGFELVLVTVLALAFLVPGIWSYTLVDPWETHYAEVARRMLQDGDLIHTKWQNEGFRSKPVLTFWLIAASMRIMGLGENGGYSGEMTSTELVMLAVRLPFVLFGVVGLVLMWWMLARLINRRVAWLASLILATSPFYCLVARQAITDMPMIGCLIGAMSCFAMAVQGGDAPLRPIWRRINSFHLFVVAVSGLVGWQIIYYAYYFAVSPRLAAGVRFPAPHFVLPGVMLVGLVGLLIWLCKLQPTRSTRQVYMYWFYTLLAVSTLAKGLPAIGLAGVICLVYVIFTNSWRELARFEIARGILICLLIVVPWHFGMWLKDGRPFLRDYFISHNWRRAAIGVHGERGTFNFFVAQIGIGMWPWVALLPAALASFFNRITGRIQLDRVRLIIGIWAVVTVAFFAIIQTKFHHYILPAIPALAMLIACWLDDWLAGRVRHIGLLALTGAAIVLLITRDLMAEQKQLIELFIYRYDRPWPSGEPWNIDLSQAFFGFGLAFAGLIVLLGARSLRRLALSGLVVAAVLFSLWASNVYMRYAGMHWGMRTAVQTYYAQRQIHGMDITYYGARQVTDEWADFDGSYEVDTVIPDHLVPDQPMTVTIELSGPGQPRQPIALYGRVARIGSDRFCIDIPDREVDKLRPLIEEGRDQARPARRPARQVNADRLIAWQLYWRGENFWTGDEIWGHSADTKTAFKNTDNKAFLNYLKPERRKGRRYFLITEAGRAKTVRSILPTPMARATYQIIDRSSNKFTLLSFTL